MKNLRIPSLILSTFLTSAALAQTSNLPEAPEPPDSTSAQPALDAAPDQSTYSSSKDSPGKDDAIAQAGTYPRFPRRPMPGPRGGGYPAVFPAPPPPLSPVGALIGFGVGGVLGAVGSGDQTGRGRLAGGLIGGGICDQIGGGIGAAYSAFHPHNNSNSERDWNDAQHKNRPMVTPATEPPVVASNAPNQLHSSELPSKRVSQTPSQMSDMASGTR